MIQRALVTKEIEVAVQDMPSQPEWVTPPLASTDNQYTIRHNGVKQTVFIEALHAHERIYSVYLDGMPWEVQLETQTDILVKSMGLSKGKKADASEVLSPMPGLIREVRVQPGDTVQAGQVLCILEAMKMENLIKAPVDGMLSDVLVQPGQAVEKGLLLIRYQ